MANEDAEILDQVRLIRDQVMIMSERLARVEERQANVLRRLLELEGCSAVYDQMMPRVEVLEDSKQTQTKMLWLILTSLLGQAMKSVGSLGDSLLK